MRAASLWLAAALAGVCPAVAAQDLVITNVRIVDGTGRVIERGNVVVEHGRIASVGEDPVAAGGETIDGTGLTALPGLIDTHRHDLLGDLQAFAALADDAAVAAAIERGTPVKLQQLLSEGFTTVMMPGVYLSAATEVRKRLADGRIPGPRLLYSGPGFTAPDDFPVKGMVCGDNNYCAARVAFQVDDADAARGHVRALADAGVDVIKVFVDDKGNALQDAVLTAIVDEAKARDLAVALHAHQVAQMLDGVRLGVKRLVHMPGDALISAGDGARLLRERDAAVATTVSFSAPEFAAAMGFPYSAAERHARILANIRHLVDEGVVVAFGTDSPDGVRPMVEIEHLRTVLTPVEIIATLTRDAAVFLGLEDAIGTLEAGKAADIVLVDGDPLTDISALGKVVLVVRDGQVVVRPGQPLQHP